MLLLALFFHFRSTGFVLEGFPRNVDEANFMQESGLFPDAGIILNVEDTDVTGRLLPPKLEKWKAKMARRLAKKLKKKEKAKKKRVSEEKAKNQCVFSNLRRTNNYFY